MKKLLPVFFLFSFIMQSNAQVTFQILYGDTTHFEIKKIIQDTTGYSFIGSVMVTGDSSDIILGTVDSLGTPLMFVKYSTLQHDFGYDYFKTPDQGYLICGTTYGSPLDPDFNDMILIKTDQLGFIQWSNVFGRSGNDEAYSVTQSFDGSYILSGHTNDDGINNNRGFILKVDVAGNPVWQNSTGILGNSRFHCGIATSDSGYIAAGSTIYPGSSGDLFVVRFDTAGQVRWSKRYGAAGFQEGNSIVQTADSGYMIVGRSSTGNALNSSDLLVVKLDTAGNVQWAKTYNHLFEDVATDVKPLSNGHYAITGHSNATDTIIPVRLVDFIEIDSAGDVIHASMYGDFTLDNLSNCITPTSDFGFVMGGSYYADPNNPHGLAYMIKTDSAGAIPLCPVYSLSLSSSPITFADSSGCDTSAVVSFYTGVNLGQAVTTSMPYSVICLGMAVNDAGNKTTTVKIYPNPVEHELTVDLGNDSEFETLKVYDVWGRKILQQMLHAGESIIHLDTDKLKAGIYQVELSGQVNHVTQKFVKTN
ncbi:MAG: T9SS type A sorting domain-containing protein [Bacteroidetes bacterium]|nr:T9SS type A sorting domain-containing protein [Bacteroidota bacterium]